MKDMRLIYLFMTMVVVYGFGMTFFMDTLGFTFGIMGMSLGTMGFIFGLICLKRIEKLTEQLKEKEILQQNYQPEQKIANKTLFMWRRKNQATQGLVRVVRHIDVFQLGVQRDVRIGIHCGDFVNLLHSIARYEPAPEK